MNMTISAFSKPVLIIQILKVLTIISKLRMSSVQYQTHPLVS